MKPIENRHIERILSLIVVLYGLWLLVQHVKSIIRYASRGLPLFETFFSEGFYAPSRIVAGGCLIVFFPFVVHWISYFATNRTVRSKRCWGSCEIFAIPLVLFGFGMFLTTCLSVINMFVFGASYGYSGVFPHWRGIVAFFFSFLFFVAVVVIFLCYARSFATWLLHKTDDLGEG